VSFFGYYVILAETDWIAEFAKKQELAEKANKLKVLLHYYNHFAAPWTLSGTTRVSRHQKGETRKVKPIWICCSKIY